MKQTHSIADVTAGRGGKAFLLTGRDKTALIDTGMAYCAPALIANLRQQLADRPLDYILITHSHYDHIGAIPHLRGAWPAVKVLGAEHAAYVFTRSRALKTIRALGAQAAAIFRAGELPPYDDALLKIDAVVDDGDNLDLGSLGVTIHATPGHTRCSLSFLVDGGTLFASESTGYMSGGKVYPSFITSSAAALASVEKCRKLNPAVIVPPHHGPLCGQARVAFWDDCEAAIRAAVAFILAHARQGRSEEEILAAYERDMRDEGSRREQPLAAFRLNTENMIRTVLRENRLSCPLAQ